MLWHQPESDFPTDSETLGMPFDLLGVNSL